MSLLKFCESIRTNGGASYNINTGELNPSTGFMVSKKGFELKVPYSPDLIENIVKLYIHGFIKELLCEDVFLGGWTYNDHLFLDVSVLVNTRDEAIALSLINDQVAYFENHGKKEVIINPLTPPTETAP